MGTALSHGPGFCETHPTEIRETHFIQHKAQRACAAQISESYFLNFADADFQPKTWANMIYRYGKDINDPDMMRFEPTTARMQAQVEKVPLTHMEGQGITQKWGDTIYRINFKVTAPKTTHALRFEITAQ